ncbi:MTRF1L release factor glutamine methyltransferase [Frankliniella fusca]|uniref:MTRF1L release factor glutamine methyltransferase n=1 Tax=Frankliniella fusca TaxID=407009 RepID=A0AAE1LQE6_9NEOP|nr:MTRF1L release factor glutamine methyltransferase [Frankliniella fusca]
MMENEIAVAHRMNALEAQLEARDRQYSELQQRHDELLHRYDELQQRHEQQQQCLEQQSPICTEPVARQQNASAERQDVSMPLSELKNKLTEARARSRSSSASSQERPSSASRRKVSLDPAEVPQARKKWSGFRVVDLDLFANELLHCVGCHKCRKPVTLTEVKVCGLSSTFELSCKKCGVLRSFRNCSNVGTDVNVIAETNRRAVFATRSVGIGHEGLKTVCALMDFPPPVSKPTYDKAIKIIHQSYKDEANLSMLRGVEREVEAEGSRDVGGSGDGSWQRRGHVSKNGTVSLIGAKSGLVMDVEVLSKVCTGCSLYSGPKEGPEFDEWKAAHMPDCSVNHDGSSGMMEVTGMVNIFQRSVETRNVRYKKYIGDGDAKTYKNICDAKPYGDDLIPEKVECVGHVQKRMSTRLRKLKKDMKGKKLKDGKPIGGLGRLTDKKIDQLATYYGNAIRAHNDVESIRNSVWATFYHYRSTDSQPQHHLCPTGDQSWCKFNKAQAMGENFCHKTSLPVAVMDAIKPIYEDLTKSELLKKCVDGMTQNPNESFNALVWKTVPKTVFCQRTKVEIGTYEAVLTFNDGQKSKIDVLDRIGVIAGKNLVNWANTVDMARINKADKRAQQETKEARRARRLAGKVHEERQCEKEGGPSYAAGEF